MNCVVPVSVPQKKGDAIVVAKSNVHRDAAGARLLAGTGAVRKRRLDVYPSGDGHCGSHAISTAGVGMAQQAHVKHATKASNVNASRAQRQDALTLAARGDDQRGVRQIGAKRGR